MRKGTVICLSIAFVALCVYSRAHAADYYPPPHPGQVIKVGPQLTCDTQEQTVAIGKAGKDDADALLAKFKEYMDTKDASGQPTCGLMDMGPSIAGEVVQIGLSHAKDGNVYMTWAVHAIAMSGQDFWILLPLMEKTSESGNKSGDTL